MPTGEPNFLSWALALIRNTFLPNQFLKKPPLQFSLLEDNQCQLVLTTQPNNIIPCINGTIFQ